MMWKKKVNKTEDSLLLSYVHFLFLNLSLSSHYLYLYIFFLCLLINNTLSKADSNKVVFHLCLHPSFIFSGGNLPLLSDNNSSMSNYLFTHLRTML